MQNKLIDLNNHLFEELERLGNEDLKGEKLVDEITRAKAISDIASKIIDNGNLALNATKTQADILGRDVTKMPDMLEEKNEK